MTALPPRHPVFYQVRYMHMHHSLHSPLTTPFTPLFLSATTPQDPFIGQAIFRLVVPTDPTTPVDIYDLDPFSLDSDGFKVSAGTRGECSACTCCGFVALWLCGAVAP